jgi:hypothetical protein
MSSKIAPTQILLTPQKFSEVLGITPFGHFRDATLPKMSFQPPKQTFHAVGRHRPKVTICLRPGKFTLAVVNPVPPKAWSSKQLTTTNSFTHPFVGFVAVCPNKSANRHMPMDFSLDDWSCTVWDNDHEGETGADACREVDFNPSPNFNLISLSLVTKEPAFVAFFPCDVGLVDEDSRVDAISKLGAITFTTHLDPQNVP